MKRHARQTFTYTVVFAAMLHLVLAAVMAIVSGRIDYLNFFNVLSISSVMPGLKTGLFSFVLSYVLAGLLVVVIYLLVLFYAGKREGRQL